MNQLNDSQRELISHIDSLIPSSGELKYDFSNEKQYDFAKMLATLGGGGEEYSGRLDTLEYIKNLQGQSTPTKTQDTSLGWQDSFNILGLNLNEAGMIASRGFATVVGGYASMNLTLIVVNQATKQIVAHGFNHDFGSTLLSVSTQNSAYSDKDVVAYLHYQYTTSDNVAEIPHAGVVKRVANKASASGPELTHPVRRTTTPNNPKALNIGLGRQWSDQGQGSQFDYAWSEAVQDHPIGKIPFVGSATFGQAISTPLVLYTNLLLNIYVADKTGGGTSPSLEPADLEKVAAEFRIDPSNPAKLNWTLSPGINTTDPGNPIVFGNVTWNSDILAYFFCEIDVVLADGTLANATIQSSDAADKDPLDGTLNIMPIDFIWHCLAENTLVVMSDGSEKYIQNVLAGDQVLVGTNREIAAVEWTNKGMHKGAIFTIETENGERISASHNHVFFTGDNVVEAADLNIGDLIKMTYGISKIKTIVTDGYAGLVYNIATAPYQDENAIVQNISTFHANKFMVGDINAQRIIKAARLNDIEWIKKRVAPYLHRDVDVFFREKHMTRPS